MKQIRRSGGYPYVCRQYEYEHWSADSDERANVFTKVMVSETKRIVDVAEERLSKIGVKCYITPGNDDEFAIDESPFASNQGLKK